KCLPESILTGLLGEIAGQLASDDPQQVEVFPVQPARDRGPRQRDHPDQALVMHQRDECPDGRLFSYPRRVSVRRHVLGTATSHVIEVEDEMALLEEARSRTTERLRGNLDGRPLPAGMEREPPVIGWREQE